LRFCREEVTGKSCLACSIGSSNHDDLFQMETASEMIR
jgi:hypothetical protein